MMDANELAAIAMEAMPLEVLADEDKGQVWGVLQMALRTLEKQYQALLDEADEETCKAKQLWLEALKQVEIVKAERDAQRTKIEQLGTDNKLMWADLMGLARESSKYVNDEVSARTATEAALTVFEMYEVAAKDREELRQERNELAVALKLLKHPNMFERGEMASGPHHGVPVMGAT